MPRRSLQGAGRPWRMKATRPRAQTAMRAGRVVARALAAARLDACPRALVATYSSALAKPRASGFDAAAKDSSWPPLPVAVRVVDRAGTVVERPASVATVRVTGSATHERYSDIAPIRGVVAQLPGLARLVVTAGDEAVSVVLTRAHGIVGEHLARPVRIVESCLAVARGLRSAHGVVGFTSRPEPAAESRLRRFRGSVHRLGCSRGRRPSFGSASRQQHR